MQEADATLLQHLIESVGATGVSAIRNEDSVSLACTVDRASFLHLVALIEDPWERGFRHAAYYFHEHGDLDVLNRYHDPKDDYFLGSWIAVQRRRYSGTAPKGEGPLTDEQVARLEAIGMIWKVGRGVKHGPRKLKPRTEEKLPPVALRKTLAVEDAVKRIRELSRTARSMQEIANDLGVVRQRVHQILNGMADKAAIMTRLQENRDAAKPKPPGPKQRFRPTAEEIKWFVDDAKTASTLRSNTPHGSVRWQARARRDARLSQWRARGMTIPEISAVTGVNEHTLHKWRQQIADTNQKEEQ